MLSMLFFITSPSFAQLSKEQINERKEIRKLAKSDLKEKASKSARKEAKKLQIGKKTIYAITFIDDESAWSENKMAMYKAIELKRHGKEIPWNFPMGC